MEVEEPSCWARDSDPGEGGPYEKQHGWGWGRPSCLVCACGRRWRCNGNGCSAYIANSPPRGHVDVIATTARFVRPAEIKPARGGGETHTSQLFPRSKHGTLHGNRIAVCSSRLRQATCCALFHHFCLAISFHPHEPFPQSQTHVTSFRQRPMMPQTVARITTRKQNALRTPEPHPLSSCRHPTQSACIA